ncbi:RagB/SusD family nutrient uptake outer membrane protein [Siphonobacter sp. BAB-5405]|uniref:RagB/SusD family nutrient uptake outer membrane protein n=1 Tax=Siphonobacter sp. BAB-5405 TaxID=1864825 RepID=UPI000C80DF0C|nr:RagB/SusD family nutrient uptake outer membrane protein [Siphonobacter sp. BAB-5405]PMD98850.1 RagB/SusD family nutrient uptake outer membrane protein [Siphonobacter sp. BAB-5405]
MKSIIFALSLLTFGLVACRDNLKEAPFSSLSEDQVFSDEEGLSKATLGVYQIWTSANYADVWSRFILSEAGQRYTTGGILGPGGDPFYRYGHLPSAGAFDAVWSRMYKVVYRANIVIDNARRAVTNDTLATPYIAEARFLRGYAYFNLVRDFGSVPLLLRQIISLNDRDLIYAPKATTEEIYAAIVEDLTFAENNLPDQWTGENLGRVSAGTAKAMLGKVYLQMAGRPLNKTEYYQRAAEKLQEVVGAENEAKYNFGLMDDFRDVFSLENERNKELVLSFGYFINSSNPNGNIFPFNLFPRGLVNGDEQTGFGYTYDFYKLYEKADTRRDFTLVDRYVFRGVANGGAQPGDSIIYDPQTWHYRVKRTGEIFLQSNFECGVAYGKLARVARPEGSPAQGYSSDLIELRFSDVLLGLAEAYVETGKPAQALPLLNRVRSRAKATLVRASDVASLRQAIRRERRLELTGEFNTVYDIRRWGTLKEEMDAITPRQIINSVLTPYNAKFEIYPIPQSQLDANPNLRQNDGW